MMATNFMKKFIPQYVGTKGVLAGYSCLAALPGRVPRGIAEDHKKTNLALWKETGSCIENQKELSYLHFGTGPRSNVAYSGCEVIAVYNLYRALFAGKKPVVEMPAFPELLYTFERDGIVLRGEFGVAPRSMYRYLKSRFMTVKTYVPALTLSAEKEKNETNRFGERYDAFLITVFNDKMNIMSMVHTMCIEKRDSGFVVHNAGIRRAADGAYCESRPFATLYEAAMHCAKNPRVLQLIGVNRM